MFQYSAFFNIANIVNFEEAIFSESLAG